MEKKKTNSIKRGADYSDAGNPWTMLATMIFTQARDDAAWLRGRAFAIQVDHSPINKFEILNFIRSDWGQMLAAYIGVSKPELDGFERFVLGGG